MHKFRTFICIALPILVLFTSGHLGAQRSKTNSEPNKHFLILATSENRRLIDNSLDFISQNWNNSFEVLLIETLYFSLYKTASQDYLDLLQEKTGQSFGFNMQEWYKWLWNKPAGYDSKYHEFKASLHTLIDPKFGKYFSQRQDVSTIRLDEVIWGGVKQDGIPPLRNPTMIMANDTKYLQDSDIVFGIEVNGDVRAYPKRILAWHEMFTDTVGGIPVAGVYCTLCGTVILYETTFNEVEHKLGTSGFLYRSNKLMYDADTQSLWSTLEGEPVIGPLVGLGIKLNFQSVVTTTWGEWKTRHPDTKVLSLKTGFTRDYSEGAAYRDYFSTDDLMFQVPAIDRRLKNKDEILAILLPDISAATLAISSRFLQKNPIYNYKLEGVQFTVFTDQSGAHRVYNTKGLMFREYNGREIAIDHRGGRWSLEENRMLSENQQELDRIHSFNAFWFGFHAAFPDTELIK